MLKRILKKVVKSLKLNFKGPEGDEAEIAEIGTYSIRRIPSLGNDAYLASHCSSLVIGGAGATFPLIRRPIGISVDGYNIPNINLLGRIANYGVYKEKYDELPSFQEFQTLTRGHASISRDHLWICFYDKIRLIDYGSMNGSFLDGEKIQDSTIEEEKEYDLKLGNVHIVMIYER